MYYQSFSRIECVSLPVYYFNNGADNNRSPFDRSKTLYGLKSFAVDTSLSEVTVDFNPRVVLFPPDYIYLVDTEGNYIFEAFPLRLIELRRSPANFLFMWEFSEPVNIDLSSSYCLTNSDNGTDIRSFLNLICGYA